MTDRPLIQAAIIVRDEAEHLERCLSSLAGLVDGAVVVDTGSVDDTIAVAQRHGAVIDHLPWQGDFATPRNRSLDLVDADWVLYIDADEELLPSGAAGDHAALRALLEHDTGHAAFRVRFVPRVGWTPFREYRLWRNRPTIRFQGLIHESIVPAVHDAAMREGLLVGDLDLLTLQHHGYEGDQSHKHARDEPMLLAQIELDPERIFLYDHLARIYEAQGDSARAVSSWMRGVDRIRARATPHPDDRLVYIDLVVHRIANGDTTDEVAALVDEALARFPGVPSLEYAAAMVEYARGDLANAAARLEWIVAMSLDEVVATNSSYDGRIFGEWGWNLLGQCRFSLGDDAGAADAFRHAEAAAPAELAYRTRRMLAEARAGERAS
jgi:glycosyltransferase involved in cell wall biosynthesis